MNYILNYLSINPLTLTLFLTPNPIIPTNAQNHRISTTPTISIPSTSLSPSFPLPSASLTTLMVRSQPPSFRRARIARAERNDNQGDRDGH